MRKGFSLIELILSLGLVVLISCSAVLATKSFSRNLLKQEKLHPLLDSGMSFLESSRILGASDLLKYDQQTLEKGKILLQVSKLNPQLYQINLKCSKPKLELSTLRFCDE